MIKFRMNFGGLDAFVKMLKKTSLFILFLLISSSELCAQSANDIKTFVKNIDNVSDDQLRTYWQKAQSEGYTLNGLEVLAKTRGVSEFQISKLKQRIRNLGASSLEGEEHTPQYFEEENTTYGLKSAADAIKIENIKNKPFGFDFFSNPKISFEPNLNLAVPKNYQLGAGDELIIEVWGAAKNNYSKIVDRRGVIVIENVGPIFLSGLTLEKAERKIINSLSKIYNGISASGNSYSKVFVDVSLSKVRNIQVNMIGEIKVPGTYTLSALSTVLNALYSAGGPSEKGTFRKIQIHRNGKLYKEFDIYKYLISGSDEGNVLLRDQDLVMVKPYQSKITIKGNVKRAGIYELLNEETFNDLLTYVGGFDSSAFREKVFVERISMGQKTYLEINTTEKTEVKLNDGDILKVGGVIDRYSNRVSIGGAVYRPGAYALAQKLTVKGLIEKAYGLRDDAYLERAIVYRTDDDVQQRVIPFSVNEILNNKELDFTLKREDSIHIYDKYSLKEASKISISGAVNKAKEIDFIENLKVEDLIAIAEGFKLGADKTFVDIFRRQNDGSFTTISKNLKIKIDERLNKNNDENIFLQPFDRVYVRYKKGFTVQKEVSIEGEVSFPGNYSLSTRDERISALIDKAGGVNNYAYIESAVLLRKNKLKGGLQLIQEQEETIIEDNKDREEIREIIKNKKYNKIGINLEKILRGGKNSEFDLILEEGDILIIPPKKNTVAVEGAVLSPTVVRYEEKYTLKDYAIFSGGFSERAKKGKSYVIHSNGSIEATKRFLFFKIYPKIKPGSIIYVPKKEDKTRVSLQEVLGITTSITTLGILLDRLIN